MSISRQFCSRMSTALLLAAGVALSGAAQAHPHVSIESQSELVFDASGRVVMIKVRWAFDEYYSVTAIEGMDTNGDGIYQPEELAPLAKENIEALEEYRYFTQASAGGEPIVYATVTDYGSVVKDGKLTLSFSIPLAAPVDPVAQKVRYSIYDPSFYIAIELAPENPVVLTGVAAKHCKIEVVPSEADAADSNNPESFYEKFASTDDIGGLYAQKIDLNCLRKTASQ